MAMMRAAVTAAHEVGWTVEQVAVPAAGSDEVLVRVRAGSINNADRGPASESGIAGFEFSGEITAVGEGVSSDLIGTRVMGTAPDAFAEFVVAHHRHVMPVPESMNFETASALPTALMTEYGALRRVDLHPGETVLITAGTSGIGVIGIQMAAELGASRVIATTRNAEHRDLLTRVGAHDVIVTDGSDLAAAVNVLTDSRGVDIVIDHVGGDMLQAAIEAARVGGRVLSVGRLAGRTAQIDLFALAKRAVTLQSVSFGFTPSTVIGDLFEGVTSHLWEAISNGTIRPAIDKVYPLEALSPALAGLQGKNSNGKIVVTL